jgi:hypothetical protein
VCGVAQAVSLGKISKKPVVLDVTNTSVLGQQFNARYDEGQSELNHGYGNFINRLNLALRWNGFTAGLRLDSSVYWRKPQDRTDLHENPVTLERDGLSRFRNTVYPAKMWLTHDRPGLEVTAGDAYAQFGRGFVLSMRKLDDLGIDNTVRGLKVSWQKDPISVTFVGGLANPSRIDEATGRSLFVRQAQALDTRGPQGIYGSDRVIGAQVQLGRGWPVTFSTHGSVFWRCAPYAYDSYGRTNDSGLLSSPLGSCEPNDVAYFATSLNGYNPAVSSRQVNMVGQSIELPSLWGKGKLYVEGVFQHREPFAAFEDPSASRYGNALYAAATISAGKTTHTLEVKSNRNFYPVAASIDGNYAPELSTVSYTALPTGELITQDNMYGAFNACVNGGRYRVDVRLLPNFFMYGQGIYAHSKTETLSGRCDELGRSPEGVVPSHAHTTVLDGLTGFEWQFDKNRSQLFVSAGVRDNKTVGGELFYRETSMQYTLTKYIKGAYSFELTGRHRQRQEDAQNTVDGVSKPWVQGEHYTAFKIAPKWVFSQGIEYTTQIGVPTFYVNGFILYRFASNSSVRLFAGQQRGGLRCVSGVCRFFPAYEGVRLDLTLRF